MLKQRQNLDRLIAIYNHFHDCRVMSQIREGLLMFTLVFTGYRLGPENNLDRLKVIPMSDLIERVKQEMVNNSFP